MSPQFTVKRNPDYPTADSWYIMLDGIEIAGPMSFAETERWFDNTEQEGIDG